MFGSIRKRKEIPFKLVSEVPGASGGMKAANKEDSRHERDAEKQNEKTDCVFKVLYLDMFGRHTRAYTAGDRDSDVVNDPEAGPTLCKGITTQYSQRLS